MRTDTVRRARSGGLLPDKLSGSIDCGCAARVEQLEREVADLRRLVETLLPKGPRDAADAALVWDLARVFGRTSFQSRSAVDAATHDAQLASALQEASVDTAKELGDLLSRMAGIDVNGLRVALVKPSTKGHLWSVVGGE